MKSFIKLVLNRFPQGKKLLHEIAAQGAFPAGHYYSPIPSQSDVAAGLQSDHGTNPPLDVDLNREAQWQLLQEFSRYYPELPFTESKQSNARYQFVDSWFCHTDAIILYSFLRHFSIRRIIEIGAGYSSAVMLDTLEKFSNGDFEITFIEPNPERLKSLVDVTADSRLRLIDRQVQDVSLDLFTRLRPGDLLFIDSSHVMKYRSDLQILMFDVLPRLPVGVHVHFHDIFYPFEYPAEWLKLGWYWNECYMLRAFLSEANYYVQPLRQFGIRGLHHQ